MWALPLVSIMGRCLDNSPADMGTKGITLGDLESVSMPAVGNNERGGGGGWTLLPWFGSFVLFPVPEVMMPRTRGRRMVVLDCDCAICHLVLE